MDGNLRKATTNWCCLPARAPWCRRWRHRRKKNIFTLRTVEDALRIREFVDEKRPASATVVGGGFIGLEMAENLAERGAKVTIVEKMEQLLSPLDADMAAFVHAKFRAGASRCGWAAP